MLLAAMGSVHRQHNRANIRALIEMGATVYLIANFSDSTAREKENKAFVEECNKNGIITINIPLGRGGFLKNVFLIPKLNQIIRKEKFDIIHAHTETGGFLFRLSMLFLRKEAAYVYTAHGMSFWKGSPKKTHILYKSIERWICSAMNANLAINQEEYDFLSSLNKKTAFLVHGIGLDINKMQRPLRNFDDIRKEFQLESGKILLVSVGELDDNKNHITVIRALARLHRKDFKYVICGVGKNSDMLLDEASELGLKDNVVLAGYRSDIPDILNAADIFVFPSFHEGLPVSALEAMACGLPLVCSKIRGNVDIVKDGNNGYLFNPTDVDMLADRLLALIDDKKSRKEMGMKNKEIVKAFSLESVTEELRQIYRAVLK